MPRTRIRGRNPGSVTTTTGGTQVGPANASSYTADTTGDIEIIFPGETVSVPTETHTFVIAYTGPAESNTAPTEAQFFDIVDGATDTISAPTLGHSTAIRAGAATVTQTVGTGWQTITNAQGLNDGTNATISSSNGTAVTGTLVLAFASLGALTAEASSAISTTVAIYWTQAQALLTNASTALAYSTDGGTNYTAIRTQTGAFTGAPDNVVIAGLTVANLANLRVRLVTSVTGGALNATASATLDAVVVSATTTGAAG